MLTKQQIQSTGNTHSKFAEKILSKFNQNLSKEMKGVETFI
jgi:hypothetical protein